MTVSSTDSHPIYVCPQSHSPLAQHDDKLSSANGDVEYPIANGIPCFLQFPPIEDDNTNTQLTQLNELAQRDGWRAAIEQVHGDNPYVTDDRRASFLDLLPINNESVVLEIGPSLGQFTPLIATRSKTVYCLEVVPGQAEFAARRCQQEGATNVHVACGGDDCRLPYADTSLDMIILNLVFEWCSSRIPNVTPLQGQQRLLQECCRILKPGGQLYLATKNRYALRYLFGKPDEHALETRFGSTLPRSLLEWIIRRSGKQGMRGLIHSYRTLCNMIEAAGFNTGRSYWAAPDLRFPQRYVATDSRSIRTARRDPEFVQGEYRSTRVIMPLIPAFLVKHFTPGLAFLATKR